MGHIDIDRRLALFGSLGAFATYALLAECVNAAPSSRLPARRWITRQDELARALGNGSMSQRAGHDAVAHLAGEADPAQLLSEIGHARIAPASVPFGHDPEKRFVSFVDETGTPRKLAYGAALFSFDGDSVITPHAHKHMASAHLVISGRIRIRTFDRIRDETGALILMPTADHVGEAGQAAAMTSAKDNVHWFAARSEHAMTRDIIVDGLDAGSERYLIQPVDIFGGEPLADGAIRAPLISFEESSQRYTARL